jgi:hypothetical protein
VFADRASRAGEVDEAFDEAPRFEAVYGRCRSPRGEIMVRAGVYAMRCPVIIAALVFGTAASSEPIRLACEGAMRANEPQHDWRLGEKYLMSLVIDLNARCDICQPEGLG